MTQESIRAASKWAYFALALLGVIAFGVGARQGSQGPTYGWGGNITTSNAACVVTACVRIDLPGPTAAVLTMGATGTWSGTIAVEESQDNGVTWTSAGTSITANGTTSYVIAGFTNFRARASAFASGNAGINFQVSNAPSGGVTSGTADPTGNTCTADQLYVQTTTGNLYSCDAGVFAKVGPSAGGGGTVTSVSFTGGLITVATPTTTPALTVAGTSGGIPYFSSASTWASSAAGTVNTLMKWGGAGNPPIASSLTDNGTTVSTAELVNFSGTGALSTSPFLLNGTLLTSGGSGTTTFPYAYLNFGASAPTTWSTSGTILGIDAPTAYAGNFLDGHVNNGASLFSISSGGGFAGASFVAGSAGGAIGWLSNSVMKSTSGNGFIVMLNNAGTGFTRLQLGGTTSSFPALQVNGASLQAELADGSAQTGWSAATYSTATNCSSAASPAVCAAAAAGSVAIPAGALQTLQVNTTAVTANSQILLTIDEGLGTKLSVTCNTTVATLTQPVVTARSAGASFTIEEPTTTSANPVCVSYMVFN